MFKYRLYPSKQQENQLQRHLDICRDVHNALLHHCRRNPTLPSQYALNMLLSTLKQEHPEYADVYSQVLQNISKRIRDAYHGYHARREAGLKAGRPRYKSACVSVLWVDVGQGSECCKEYLGDRAGTARIEACGEHGLCVALRGWASRLCESGSLPTCREVVHSLNGYITKRRRVRQWNKSMKT